MQHEGETETDSAARDVRISLIVAMDRRRVIGRGGTLPWHLPNDLKRFREITMGKPLLMGRRTHESIGRALPGRRNIVLSRTPGYRVEGCDVFTSLSDALASLARATEVMVIGGVAVYRDALPASARIYLTRVDAEVGGDTYFPAMVSGEWREVAREQHGRDEQHGYDYAFCILDRVSRMVPRAKN